MIPNPLARQRRLGRALVELRDDRGYSHKELAAKSGVSASVISRLETPFSDVARRPNLLFVRRLLDALAVPRGSGVATRIEGYAEDAAAGGWWEDHPRMGIGQRDVAITETGAGVISEYAGLLLPGLVQTAAYAEHRTAGDADAAAIVAGRMERQRHAADVTYRLVLEEPAVRRWPVPAAVMLEQLRHLLALAERPNVSLRVLAVDADLGAGTAPRTPFVHISYPDPDDPEIVTVDTAAELQFVAGGGVSGYAQLHQRLCAAAMSDADTASLIRSVADFLAARI